MLVPITGVGNVGIVKDIPPEELPPAAWTDAKNMVFRDNAVHKRLGSAAVFTPSVIPYGLVQCTYNGVRYWMYMGLAKAYGFQGSSEADITNVGGDYTGSINDQWNATNFNGIPIINNGVDDPQAWNTPSLSTPLVDLPNWPASTTCKVMRHFRYFLIALDVTESGTRNRRMVKWSHTADPGSVPTSWDETDATKDAGEFSLGEGVDGLVDCLTFGDFNIIYTESSTWLQALTGTDAIFSFTRRFGNSGMLSQGCGAKLLNKHFVVTQDDIILHNAQDAESLADQRLRSWFFGQLHPASYSYTKVAVNRLRREVWICYSPDSGAVLTQALVWHWPTNTWGVRDLPSIRAITEIREPLSEYTALDAYTSSFDSTVGEFDIDVTAQQINSVIYSPASLAGISLLDVDSFQDLGVDFESYVQREGLAIAGVTKEGKVIVDPSKRKLVTEIRPYIDGANGDVIEVTIGSQERPGGAITWGNSANFTIGTDRWVPAYSSGRYFVSKFGDGGNVSNHWKLLGYDVNVEVLGEY